MLLFNGFRATRSESPTLLVKDWKWARMTGGRSRDERDRSVDERKTIDKERRSARRKKEDVAGGAVIGLAKENGHVVGASAMRAPSRNGMGQGEGEDERTAAAGGWEAGCSALHRKARTSALHPPAVAQCTLPCAPPPI